MGSRGGPVIDFATKTLGQGSTRTFLKPLLSRYPIITGEFESLPKCSLTRTRAPQVLLVGDRNDAQILPPSLTSGQLALNGIVNNIDRVLLPPLNVRPPLDPLLTPSTAAECAPLPVVRVSTPKGAVVQPRVNAPEGIG
eukprot:3509011-Pyramimonas_sp.AAC.1